MKQTHDKTLQLTDLECQLIRIVRTMADDAKESLVHMAAGIAHGSPAIRPNLRLVYWRGDSAAHQASPQQWT
jgi:hypothetical protein